MEDLSRAAVIAAIRTSLKRRSGKQWSVTGGQGTAYGWIRIAAIKKYAANQYGNLTQADCRELARLFDLTSPVHVQGLSIPAGHDYYREYMARAAGCTPPVIATPYWD